MLEVISGPGVPPKLYSLAFLSDNNRLAFSHGETGVEMKIPAATGPRAGLVEEPALPAFGRQQGSDLEMQCPGLLGKLKIPHYAKA